MMKKFDTRDFVSLVLAVLLFGSLAQAAPGDLDLSFGGTGKVRLGFGFGYDVAAAAAEQTDGKLVVAGSGFIVRYNIDGALDSSFGDGGKVRTPNGFGVNALKIRVDGKFVLAGADSGDFAVMRFNADGTPDLTFGNDGKVVTDLSDSSSDRANALALQPDNKIVVAGTVKMPGTGEDFAVVRYNANGTLDPTFNGSGTVVTAISTNSDRAWSVALQDDGRIIVGGIRLQPRQDFTVVRYTANGALDPTFGVGGIVTTQIGEGGGIGRIYFEKGNGTRTNPDRIIAVGEAFAFGRMAIAAACYYTSGDLQTSFGTGGTAVYSVSQYPVYFGGIMPIVDPDHPDKIVVGGTEGDVIAGTGPNRTDFTVMLLDGDGALDPTFDGDGVATVALAGNDRVLGVTSQLGKIVLFGSTKAFSVAGETDFGIMRFNLTGALDTSFDGDGIRIDDFSNGFAEGRATAIQADGKIVVVGTSPLGLSVARFNANGTPDVLFNSSGKAITSTQDSRGNAVAIQSNGKIVTAGRVSNGFFVARFNSNGSRDTTFGSQGTVTTAIGPNSSGNAVRIQADGKIVVAGTSNGNFVLVRYTQYGSLDTSFGTNGIVTTTGGSGNAMAIQADGKIVVAGYSRVGTTDDFAVLRYNANGSLDTTFGGLKGRVTTPVGSSTDRANAVSIQPDGKIVVAGYSLNVNLNTDFALVRYNPSGTLDASFDGDGKLTTQVGIADNEARTLVIQPDGRILAAGYGRVGQRADFAIVRYNADGSLDNSFWDSAGLFGNDGKVFVDFNGGSDGANAIALDSAGRPVVVGYGDGVFGVVRLQGF